MRWLNRFVIGPLSPKWALQREAAARALKAFYEASEPARTRKDRADRRSANVLNDKSLVKLRTQARHLEENLDIASGALDVLVANTVGTGIRPEPQVLLTSGEPAEDVNRQLLQLYDDWHYRPEVTWEHDYYALQRLLARSWFRDGEAFLQHIVGPASLLDHGTTVPYSLEALEADFVPVDFNDQARGIRQGVERSEWGKPRAYFVYLNHPGEQLATGAYVSAPLATKRVLADRMSHLKFTKRLHQVRGMTLFAPVLIRFDDIKEIDESERVAARVAAAMAAYVKKGTPDTYEAPTQTDEQGNPLPRELQWEPGIIFDNLRPGEDIGTISSNRPNNALIPFRDAQLRSGAAGLMTSYSSLSKNYNGTYSAQRQELVEQFVVYRMLASPFVYRVCQPVWDNLITAALSAGVLRVPANVDRSTLYDCSHTAPPMVWIDPLKEAEALVLQMQWGLKSRSRIIRERGDSPDQVNREIRQDQRDRERFGIRVGEGAAAAPQDDDDDEGSATTEARRVLDTIDAVAKRGKGGRPVVLNVHTGATERL